MNRIELIASIHTSFRNLCIHAWCNQEIRTHSAGWIQNYSSTHKAITENSTTPILIRTTSYHRHSKARSKWRPNKCTQARRASAILIGTSPSTASVTVRSPRPPQCYSIPSASPRLSRVSLGSSSSRASIGRSLTPRGRRGMIQVGQRRRDCFLLRRAHSGSACLPEAASENSIGPRRRCCCAAFFCPGRFSHRVVLAWLFAYWEDSIGTTIFLDARRKSFSGNGSMVAWTWIETFVLAFASIAQSLQYPGNI